MDLLDRGFELKDLSDTGTFSGYGNVYGVVDQGNDIVAHQAFAESLDAMKSKGRSNKPFVSAYVTRRVGGRVVNSEAVRFLKIGTS